MLAVWLITVVKLQLWNHNESDFVIDEFNKNMVFVNFVKHKQFW